jgi:SNF2 family DNA or RNA helicase
LHLTYGRIEDALDVAGIRFDRLDGKMKRDERTKAMDALKHDPGCEVLLVSLKAGGVGLNLTAAQRVYLMDPYWYQFIVQRLGVPEFANLYLQEPCS